MKNNRKSKTRTARLAMAARMLAGSFCLCMGALLVPVTAYAQSDTTPPIITAEVSGETLTVAASDDVSGVAAIHVDGNRITTLVNGGATVNLKDYAGSAAQISVYAVDNAGNKSETVKFTNPYYQAPVQLPPASAPVAPSSSSSVPASSSSPSNSAAGSSAPASSSSSSTESAVPDSGSGALTPDGTGTVQDNATDEDGKEFFTITTADGTVYYLVIDRQRGSENVYFLDTVKPEDLLALAESGAIPGETAIPGATDPDPAPDPSTSEPGEESDPEPEQESGGMGTILFVILAVAAAGGAGWYFKIYRPKQQAGMDDEFNDLEDADDSEDGGEYGFDDDGPPFDLDDEPGRDEYEQDDGIEYDPAGEDE